MKKLNVYSVYLDDGKDVFRVTVPAAHGKRPTEKGNKKEVGAAAGRVYLFFRVILPGRSFFRGVVRGGRLESIAGHSFPRGVHDIPRHAFPGVGGGCVQILFNFFRDSN